MKVKILSWNVNGLRTFKRPLQSIFNELEADLICFQETKITRDMLSEDLALLQGFSSYFSFCKKRSGYSGVATYAKNSLTPYFACDGLTGIFAEAPSNNSSENLLSDHSTTSSCHCLQYKSVDFQAAARAATSILPDKFGSKLEQRELDSEGRAVITIHQCIRKDNGCPCGSQHLVPLAVINVYCPRADPEREERSQYKLQFYHVLRARAALLEAAGAHVIVLGDLNTSHTLLDHCDPDEDFHENPGRLFLNEFIWSLDKKDEFGIVCSNNNDDDCSVVDKFKMIDTFRWLYPKQKDAFTCWNTKANARETNYGTRIDYILCDSSFISIVEDSMVLQQVYGSDHCPIALIAGLSFLPSVRLPLFCTKNFLEFQGQQQKLSQYFKKSNNLNSKPNFLHECTSFEFQDKNDKNFDVQEDALATEDAACSRLSLGNSKTPKRKLKDSFNSGTKKKQQNLLSFFGQPKHSATDAKEPSSLYEAEMKFLKTNPDIYNKLGLKDDGTVDMSALEALCFQTNFGHLTPKSNSNSSCSSHDTGSSADEPLVKNISVNDKNDTLRNNILNVVKRSNEWSFPENNTSQINNEGDQETSNGLTCSTSQEDPWSFMKQPKLVVPLCSGHGEPCSLKTCKKKGPNFNRRFFACSRGVGRPGQKEAQCKFFKWI